METGYGDEVALTEKKRLHTCKIMKEGPTVINQLCLKNIYNSDLGYNLKEKLWSNQQFKALNVYKNIDADSAET